MKGKYRKRTWIRGRLPMALSWLSPKGPNDCGDHDWYLASEGEWHCYHCKVGVTNEIPWSAAQQVEYTAASLGALLEARSERKPTPAESDAIDQLAARLVSALEDVELVRRAGSPADETNLWFQLAHPAR